MPHGKTWLYRSYLSFNYFSTISVYKNIQCFIQHTIWYLIKHKFCKCVLILSIQYQHFQIEFQKTLNGFQKTPKNWMLYSNKKWFVFIITFISTICWMNKIVKWTEIFLDIESSMGKYFSIVLQAMI